MKIKTITDAILAGVMLVIVSCATHIPQVESPPGKYVIHQKDDNGSTVAVYKTNRFTETMSGDDLLLNFIDSEGKPQSLKSYDIFKL